VQQRRTAFFRARSFLALAVRQGQALRDLWEWFTADREQIASRALALLMQMHADDYVLVLALSQACQWLEILAQHEPILKNEVRAFVASLPDIGELRDMWEHEIDYFNGRGKRPDRWLRPLDPNVSIMQGATAGSIWHEEDGRWTHRIGGRLDAAAAVAAATKMLSAVDVAFERLPPLGDGGGADQYEHGPDLNVVRTWSSAVLTPGQGSAPDDRLST
jgi:hypothetical protein